MMCDMVDNAIDGGPDFTDSAPDYRHKRRPRRVLEANGAQIDRSGRAWGER
jgi:hypothetical protein